MENNEIVLDGNWLKFLNTVMKIPGVKVDKNEFLTKQFSQYCDEYQVIKILENETKSANIDIEVLDKLAGKVIKYHGALVTGGGFVTGLPGGPTILAAIPADLAQFYFHIIQVVQKLAYIYGEQNLDDEDFLLYITLFLGVMTGATGAAKALMELSKESAKNVGKRVARTALTKGTLYPIIKKIAGKLGIKVTKQTVSRAVSKIIPIVGGILGSGINAATFFPMANRLKKQLRNNYLFLLWKL